VCVASELKLQREKRKLQKKHIEAKKAKKKNKERALFSLFLTLISNTKDVKHISMAGARLIVFYFATLSPSYSLSLSLSLKGESVSSFVFV